MNAGFYGFPKGVGDLIAWLVPPGVGFDWWFDETDIPGLNRWYIVPYGQDILQSQFPRTYAKWTKGGVHKYGAGSVPNSTKAPDKRGRVSVARDSMGGTGANRVTSGASGINGATLGAVGGAETVATSIAQEANHNHTTYSECWTNQAGGAAVQFSPISSATYNITTQTVGGNGGSSGGTAGSGSPHQNMQPSIVCNYIIRVG